MSDLTSSIDSLYTSNTYNTNSSTKALQSTLSSTDLSGATDDELLSVCKDFESYFVEQVFKAMQKMVPENKDAESSSSNSLADYYKDEMTNKYAESASESNNGKGLGIANVLYEQMKRNYGTLE